MYFSPNIIRQVRPRRLVWTGHVAGMKEERKLKKVACCWKAGKKETTQKTEAQMDVWD
jgi:hypothetical protein